MGEIKTTARTTERSASIEFDGLDSSMSQHCDVPLVDKFYFKFCALVHRVSDFSNPRRVRIPRVGVKPGMELHLQIGTRG